MDNQNLVITERELKEIHLCCLYLLKFRHGTAGHNQMMIIGKMADHLGFRLDENGGIVVPEGVEVIKDSPR